MSERYIGCIDKISSQHISGWIFNAANVDEVVTVDILYCGVVIGKLTADEEREDVEKVYGKKKCGFNAALSGVNFFNNYQEYQFRISGKNFLINKSDQEKTAIPQDVRLKRHKILSYIANSSVLSKKVVIIAMFTNDDTLSMSQLHNILSYKKLGYAVVAVMATDRNPTLIHIELAKHVDFVIMRGNFGLDFSSWAAALDLFSDSICDIDEIILTNDSVVGPKNSFLLDIEVMQSKNLDFWGITDCWIHTYHVQSYFLFFNKGSHKALVRFFDDYIPSDDKENIIQNGEIRLSQYLIKSNLTHGVLCRYDVAADHALKYFSGSFEGLNQYPEYISSRKSPYNVSLTNTEYKSAFFADTITSIRNRTPLNPTHHFWYPLMVNMKIPFIKRELIVKNPVGVPDIENISEAFLMPEYCHMTSLVEDVLIRESKSMAIWSGRGPGFYTK